MIPLLRCVARCSALVLPALLAGACAARPTASPAVASASATSARYFPPPGDAWERRSPAAVGMDSAWTAATVDEQWQLDQWGEDEEAVKALAGRRFDFEAGARFLALL